MSEFIYNRILDIRSNLQNKSFFLFGPRATGKTHLINQKLSNDSLIINLLKSNHFVRLSAHPEYIEEMIDNYQG